MDGEHLAIARVKRNTSPFQLLTIYFRDSSSEDKGCIEWRDNFDELGYAWSDSVPKHRSLLVSNDSLIEVYSQRAHPGDWLSIAASRAEDVKEQKGLGQFRAFLANDFTQKNHLAVIAGLGCSLDAADSGGNRIAPTMASLWTDIAKLSIGASGGTFLEMCELFNSRLLPENRGPNIENVLSYFDSWLEVSTKVDPNREIVREGVQIAKREIVRQCNFIDSDTDLTNHQQFLERLVWPHGQFRMHLFTTNYDRCFEEAASRADMIVIDGFDFSTTPRFNANVFGMDIGYVDHSNKSKGKPPLFKLYKLHGSIDWRRIISKDYSRIERADSEDPCIIYPQTRKYEMSYATPFAEMFSHLQNALNSPQPNVIVIGFGFNDSHITQSIMSMVATNPEMNLIVVDPGIKGRVESDETSVFSRLYYLAREQKDRRIHLVNATFGNFWKILPKQKTPADIDLIRKMR